MILLSGKNKKIDTVIELTRSKSESNRALILKALFDEPLEIDNLSDSDDSKVLFSALKDYSLKEKINVGHAGTSFRFLTAFLASREKGDWILTGSERMKERPVKLLVDALNSMGAKITYLENEGYPPLKIIGNSALHNDVRIDAGISSQYISALMMIGSRFSEGLTIHLEGKITSRPYLLMTISMMKEIGIDVDFDDSLIRVQYTKELPNPKLSIEADWSAASYWFSVVAMSELGSNIELIGLNERSRQGDSKIVSYYEALGVDSKFKNNRWTIKKVSDPKVEVLNLDLSSTPDVAQTLVCSCAGLGVGVKFTGLHTLRIKETDRLTALKNELAKFGIDLEVPSDDELIMTKGQVLQNPTQPIATYKDHRMAMAFAPLSLLANLSIENEDVVTKSYPDFWEDLKKIVSVES